MFDFRYNLPLVTTKDGDGGSAAETNHAGDVTNVKAEEAGNNLGEAGVGAGAFSGVTARLLSGAAGGTCAGGGDGSGEDGEGNGGDDSEFGEHFED